MMQNSTARIMFIIYVCLSFITVFFISFGYYNQLMLLEENESRKLEILATSWALNIDGEAHDLLMKNHLSKDGVKALGESPLYDKIQKQLQLAFDKNNLHDVLYTIVYNAESKKFEYGVRSDDQVYFRNEYSQFPKELLEKKETGGVLAPYQTENGEWISAFYPIRNNKGEVVALLEADIKLDDFKELVFAHYNKQGMISLAVILVLAIFLIRYTRKLLAKEDQIKEKIIEQKELIEMKNKDITDSINYALQIQEALLPCVKSVMESLPNSFIFYKPRDIVSGDFYWYKEVGDKIMIAAADCTGHGIPGALMSMMGHSILNAITDQGHITDPGEVLTRLDVAITQALTPKEEGREPKDGMDIILSVIDTKKNTVQYAGAFRPLLRINGEVVDELKGNRFPIGGGESYNKTAFTSQTIITNKDDMFFMFSDGFPDQFGGERLKKYMTKRFKKFLGSIQDDTAEVQMEKLEHELLRWRGEEEQVDDILVIGFRV